MLKESASSPPFMQEWKIGAVPWNGRKKANQLYTNPDDRKRGQEILKLYETMRAFHDRLNPDKA